MWWIYTGHIIYCIVIDGSTYWFVGKLFESVFYIMFAENLKQ